MTTRCVRSVWPAWLCLSLLAATPTWATCSNSVVDVGLVTTVTVTASANDTCSWNDNNANNARLLSMAGTAVPPLLGAYSAHFLASSINLSGQKWPVRYSECGVVNVPACTNAIILITDDHPSKAGYRECRSRNTDALSSTAVCIFESVVP